MGLQDPEVVGALTLCWATPPAIHFVLLKLPLLGLLSPQTPFSLTLRLWDIYILEVEQILTAMAYIVIKMHRNE